VTQDLDTTPERGSGRSGRTWWLVGLAIAALVVIVFAPLASGDPDGLERVAEDQGFLGAALDALYSIIPDYTIPGVDGNLSTVIAGLIGVAIVFAIMVGLGRLLARRRS
jgi:Na+/H+-dicarboxylate symporter